MPTRQSAEDNSQLLYMDFGRIKQTNLIFLSIKKRPKITKSIPLTISNKKLTIIYKEQSAYSPASQQKVAAEYYR